MNRFRHTVSVLSLVMVLLLLAGCLPKAGVTEYTLTVNVKPEGAAEVEGVAEKYEKNAIATFKLIANEGYEFVEWEGDVKPTETDDGQWEIIMDGDKTLTAVFKEIEEEEEEDIEELIAAAEAAIEALPEEITLEDADQVAEARELVNAVLAIDEDAEIEGIEKLEAAEEALQTLARNPVNEDLVADALKKANEGLDLKTAFKGEELGLPEELTVGTHSYVLIWTTDSPDVVEIEEGKAKITRPEETTTVTLTATLGYDISAQAQTKPQSFDFKIDVWGWVSELKSRADEYVGAGDPTGSTEAFEKALKELVPDYDKDLVAVWDGEDPSKLVGGYIWAIHDALQVETKADVLAIIESVNTDKVKAFNNAVAAYYAATTKTAKEDALKAVDEQVGELGLERWVKGEGDEFVEGFAEQYYLPALRDGDTSDVPKIQAIVDAVNLGVLAELVETAEADPRVKAKGDGETVVNAQNILSEYTDEDEFVEDFADILNEYELRLKVAQWVHDVLNADEDSVIEELKQIVEDGAEVVVELKNVIEEIPSDIASERKLGCAYAQAMAELKGAVTVAQVEAAVSAVNAAALQEAIEAVLEAEAGEDVVKELKVLQHIAGREVMTAEIDEDSGDEYVAAIAAAQPTTAAGINDIVAEVNKLALINGAADAEELKSVIELEFEVTAFIDLMPKERREELAGIIYDGIGEDEGKKMYTSTAEFVADVEARVAEYRAAIDAINTVERISDMQDALRVASKLLNGQDEIYTPDEAEKALESRGKGYATIGEALAAALSQGQGGV